MLIISANVAADARNGVELEIIPDPKYRRLKAVIDMPLALYKFDTERYIRFEYYVTLSSNFCIHFI